MNIYSMEQFVRSHWKRAPGWRWKSGRKEFYLLGSYTGTRTWPKGDQIQLSSVKPKQDCVWEDNETPIWGQQRWPWMHQQQTDTPSSYACFWPCHGAGGCLSATSGLPSSMEWRRLESSTSNSLCEGYHNAFSKASGLPIRLVKKLELASHSLTHHREVHQVHASGGAF